MKSSRFLKLAILAVICAFALAFTAGCSLFVNPFATSGGGSSTPSSSSVATSSVTQSSKASSTTTQQSKSTGGAGGLTADSAKAQGYQVFQGTVHVCNAQGVLDLQKKNIDPSVVGSGNGTYAVLVFDKPAQVIGQGADGSGERTETANMLGVAEYTAYSSMVIEYGNLDYWKTIDGQHVTVAARAADIWFPSDVSLPIGEPTAKSSIVIS